MKENEHEHILHCRCVYTTQQCIYDESSAMKATHSISMFMSGSMYVFDIFFSHISTLRCRKESIENGTGVGNLANTEKEFSSQKKNKKRKKLRETNKERKTHRHSKRQRRSARA